MLLKRTSDEISIKGTFSSNKDNKPLIIDDLEIRTAMFNSFEYGKNVYLYGLDKKKKDIRTYLFPINDSPKQIKYMSVMLFGM